MRIASLVPLFLLVGACAASSNDVASTESAVSGQNICDTLDYGPRPAPNDAYFFFADTAAAATYMEKAQSAGVLAYLGGPDAKFADIEAPDSRIGRLVAEVFAGYRLVFPQEMSGLDTPPPVALLATKIMNAFVFGAGAGAAPGDEKKLPWIFVVHTALADAADDTQLRAIIAHELGHLILRNGTAEVRQFVRVSYSLAAGEDGVLAETQADDPAASLRVRQLQNYEARLGPFYALGHDPTGAGYYDDKFLVPLWDPDHTSCSAALALEEDWGNLVWPFVVAGNRTPEAGDAAKLAAASDAYLAQLKICMAESTDTRTIAEAFTTTFHLTPNQLKDTLFNEERAADADPTLTTLGLRLIAAEQALRARAIAWRTDATLPTPGLRYYDMEEDADDDAVRVLRAIGRTDGATDPELLFMTPDARTQCLAAIAAGTPMDYGALGEPHHTGCWRAYHKRQLMTALDRCAPATTTKRPLRVPVPIEAPLVPAPPVID